MRKMEAVRLAAEQFANTKTNNENERKDLIEAFEEGYRLGQRPKTEPIIKNEFPPNPPIYGYE